MSRSVAFLCAMALASLCGLVAAFRPAGFLPAISASTARPVSVTRYLSPSTFSSRQSRSSRSRLFEGPPSRPTRENEPDEYFKSNLEKKDLAERLVDPQVVIAVVSILAPFVAVGVLLGGGFLTR
ncbi:hypothetical protein VYU27_006069 [Nannochloropsis oceanica]